jgi:hypothetical protein
MISRMCLSAPRGALPTGHEQGPKGGQREHEERGQDPQPYLRHMLRLRSGGLLASLDCCEAHATEDRQSSEQRQGKQDPRHASTLAAATALRPLAVIASGTARNSTRVYGVGDSAQSPPAHSKAPIETMRAASFIQNGTFLQRCGGRGHPPADRASRAAP